MCKLRNLRWRMSSRGYRWGRFPLRNQPGCMRWVRNMRKRMSNRGYHRRVICTERTKKEVLRGLPFFIHTFQNLQRSQLLQSILFYHCISMFQQKCFSGQGEGFLSAVLRKNVADFVEFFRWVTGLMDDKLITSLIAFFDNGIWKSSSGLFWMSAFSSLTALTL